MIRANSTRRWAVTGIAIVKITFSYVDDFRVMSTTFLSGPCITGKHLSKFRLSKYGGKINQCQEEI